MTAKEIINMWKKLHFFGIVLVLMGLLTCCGRTPQSFFDGSSSKENTTEATSNESVETVYYTVQETALPDPNEKISALLEEGDNYIADNPVLHGNSVFRYIYIFDENGRLKSNYLQILELSDMKWINISGSKDFEIEGTRYAGFHDLFFSEGEELYCFVYQSEEKTTYLGKLGESGIEAILCPVPLELEWANLLTWDKSGNGYYYNEYENIFSYLDGQLQTQRRVTPSETIHGILQRNAETDAYWYGVDEKNRIIVRNMVTGETLLEDFDGVNSYSYTVEYSDDGTLFLADSQSIWKVDGEPELVYHFARNDYIVDALYGMAAGENGEMLLLVQMGGRYMLLTLRENDTPPPTEKQEIVIAFIWEPVAMDAIIANFNRQSEQYHVSVVLAEENENGLDYADRMQLEVSAGGGPDILGHDVVQNITSYMENGYLECLDGVLEDDSRYLQAALEDCQFDGKLYGIPYDCTLEFVSYPKAVTGGQTALTISELMEAVRASGAKILERGCGGMDIVMHYGLYDNSNTAYIDWTNGKSHLAEDFFLELLAFAKEYGDTGELSGEVGELISTGYAAAVSTTMDKTEQLPSVDAYFQGEAAMIGYPRAEGNGIYVNSRALYVNVNSDCKEGAKEFLRYLLSEEAQRQYIGYDAYEHVGVWGYQPQFPVHMGAYEALMEEAMESKVVEHEDDYLAYGIEYNNTAYTKEQVDKFYFLLEHAQPGRHNVMRIRSIIYEELAPYFAGDITAEQAAQILDNRVQLYLDERGN